jgi:uncharacterized protein DUF4258
MIGAARARAKVPAIKLTAAVAEKRIKQAAQVTANIIWSNHARQRMEERDISDVDVLRILRTGHVDDPPVRTERDEWNARSY